MLITQWKAIVMMTVSKHMVHWHFFRTRRIHIVDDFGGIDFEAKLVFRPCGKAFLMRNRKSEGKQEAKLRRRNEQQRKAWENVNLQEKKNLDIIFHQNIGGWVKQHRGK